MKQEDKKLLIKDLSTRLPYGVRCKILETNETKILASIREDWENTLFDFWDGDRKIQYEYQLYLSEFKPYLFPMSSMTEEQRKEWQSFMIRDVYGILYHTIESYDYLNKHHFDYRGLIEKGLALDATGLDIY